MNSPKKKTLRLVNLLPTNSLSISLHHFRAPASPSIRRAVLLTPINIPPGGMLDLCHHLGVSFEEADRIVQQSPEVKAMAQARNALRVEVYPPDPPVLTDAPAPGPVVLTEAPTALAEVFTPVLPVTSEPVLTPAPITSPAPAPVLPVAPSVAPPVAPSLQFGPSATQTSAVTSPAPTTQPSGAAPARRTVVLEEPSTEWSEEKLRAYADERGIDVSALKSKTQVLRAIRGK